MRTRVAKANNFLVLQLRKQTDCNGIQPSIRQFERILNQLLVRVLQVVVTRPCAGDDGPGHPHAAAGSGGWAMCNQC